MTESDGKSSLDSASTYAIHNRTKCVCHGPTKSTRDTMAMPPSKWDPSSWVNREEWGSGDPNHQHTDWNIKHVAWPWSHSLWQTNILLETKTTNKSTITINVPFPIYSYLKLPKGSCQLSPPLHIYVYIYIYTYSGLFMWSAAFCIWICDLSVLYPLPSLLIRVKERYSQFMEYLRSFIMSFQSPNIHNIIYLLNNQPSYQIKNQPS